MLDKIKERIFPFIIALSALSVSASAAFYSVTGLSKLFAGASFAVIIMASSLEISKLVIASLLYQYWDKLNKLLKIYLTIAASILILITSAGIYGFLSSAYQETANKSGLVDSQVKLLETKKQSFEKIKSQYEIEKTSITKNITSLRNALGNNNQSYVDSDGNTITYSSSANRRAFERQLETALQKDEKLTEKIQVLNDSVLNLETRIVETQNNSEVAAELGPLKYLSGLTGTPMDKIINYLLLVIIFVFDPLAIALVIAANFAFAQLKKKDDSLEIEDQDEWDSTLEDGLEDEDWEDKDPPNEELIKDVETYKSTSENQEPYQIYVSGSEDQDWVIEDEEEVERQQIIDSLNNLEKFATSINTAEHYKKSATLNEINRLKQLEEKKRRNRKPKDDDNIITYN